jgi:hypothetical protein
MVDLTELRARLKKIEESVADTSMDEAKGDIHSYTPPEQPSKWRKRSITVKPGVFDIEKLWEAAIRLIDHDDNLETTEVGELKNIVAELEKIIQKNEARNNQQGQAA